MVKCVYFLFFIMSGFIFANESKIDVILDQTTISEGNPVTGVLNITHDPRQVIDMDSVKYDNKKIRVDNVNKVRFGPDLVVESLRFKLEGQPVGLHMLSPFTIIVGSETLRSIPLSLEVKGRVSQPSPASNPAGARSGKDQTSFLKLEALFPSSGPFYPGQKITVGYRYTFQGNIELRQEVLPLLDQTDVTKLGEKQIEDEQKGNVSIREVTQVLQLSNPGEYLFPKSFVSGYAYFDRGWGPKTYFEPALTSEIPAIKLVVNPFPENKKPPFFTGSVGPFEIGRSVTVPPFFKIGDKLTYNLSFKGGGEISTLKPLNLLCQPGWSGFFSVGDLPPQGANKKGEMVFSYEVRPLNFLVSEIPPVYFAYFDPNLVQYKIIKTEPFKYTLKEEERKKETKADPVQELTMTASLKPKGRFLMDEGPHFSTSAPPFATSSVLWMIPASLFGYYFWSYYQEKERALKSRPKSVKQQLLDLSLKINDESFVEGAESLISQVYGPLPYPKPVQDYLNELQEARFGVSPAPSFEYYYKELEDLCMPSGSQASIKN